jgi:hypothetical protein
MEVKSGWWMVSAALSNSGFVRFLGSGSGVPSFAHYEMKPPTLLFRTPIYEHIHSTKDWI